MASPDVDPIRAATRRRGPDRQRLGGLRLRAAALGPVRRGRAAARLAPPATTAEPGRVEPEVLLQLRAGWTHQGGTWALPGRRARPRRDGRAGRAAGGGARRPASTPAGVRTGGRSWSSTTGRWSYTYVLAEIDRPAAELVAADEETEDLAWVPLDEVAAYPLHPLFAQAWPDLLAAAAGARSGAADPGLGQRRADQRADLADLDQEPVVPVRRADQRAPGAAAGTAATISSDSRGG